MRSSPVLRNSNFSRPLNVATGNIICNCCTSDRRREEEEEDKHRDRISDLPDDILHLILSFLPLKSVAQTSVLARRWSHIWSSYPIIDFYEIFTGDEVHHQIKAMIIETVLAGCREKFDIKVSRVESAPNSRNLGKQECLGLPRVEKLELDLSVREKRDDLAQCKLKCHSLRSLEYKHSGCGSSWLGFPSSYIVGSFFRTLHSLSLNHIYFLDSALGLELFSGSSFSSLEKLKIEKCGGISDLKISCPNLKDLEVWFPLMDFDSLDISGMKLEDLTVVMCNDGNWFNIFAPNLQSFYWDSGALTGKCSIQSFPTLKDLYIGWSHDVGKSTTIYNNGIALLSSSSQVEYLDIFYDFLQTLSEIYFEFGGLPFSFMKLKNLLIDIELGKQQFPGVACLLKSSPVVHELTIYFDVDEGKHEYWNNSLLDDANCSEEQYWETQAQYMSPFLSHLEAVDIDVGERETIPECAVSFAKFLLKYGKSLKRFIISNDNGPRNSLNDIIRLLEKSPRASYYVQFLTFCDGKRVEYKC
uniref:putative F-box/FBD/LRR-repeat protein At4g03220 n=1 Tax=Fragaria vesca subsp. vesca TaxID=101020 RepID=UPI0005CA9A44|nr:PREDICTED: putative F-box/FBD/LRR-repeat protein At4g03220 [Fragaria vesca subsp. vesca]